MDKREFERRLAIKQEEPVSKTIIHPVGEIGSTKVIVVGRNSRGSYKKNNLWKFAIQRIAENVGLQIETDENNDPLVFCETASGKLSKIHIRKELKRAVEIARKFNLPILVPSPSRLLRNEDYDPVFGKNLKPTDQEWKSLVEQLGCEDVKFYSLLDPKCSIQEDEAFLSKIAIDHIRTRTPSKPRTSGFRTRRRKQCKDRVIELIKQGMTTREVADEITNGFGFSITAMTVCRWVKENEEKCVLS